jgi:hypothetical protein
MQHEVPRPHLPYEGVRPVLLTPVIELRCEQVGTDVSPVGDLKPVPLLRVRGHTVYVPGKVRMHGAEGDVRGEKVVLKAALGQEDITEYGGP